MNNEEIQARIQKKVLAEDTDTGEVFEPSLMALVADVTSHCAVTEEQAIELIRNSTCDNELNTKHGYVVWCE